MNTTKIERKEKAIMFRTKQITTYLNLELLIYKVLVVVFLRATQDWKVEQINNTIKVADKFYTTNNQ